MVPGILGDPEIQLHGDAGGANGLHGGRHGGQTGIAAGVLADLGDLILVHVEQIGHGGYRIGKERNRHLGAVVAFGQALVQPGDALFGHFDPGGAQAVGNARCGAAGAGQAAARNAGNAGAAGKARPLKDRAGIGAEDDRRTLVIGKARGRAMHRG